MVHFQLYRNRFLLLLIIVCISCTSQLAAQEAHPDTALQLWQKSLTLEEEANLIISELEADRDTSRIDSLVIHEKIAAQSLLLKSMQLKKDYYAYILDSISNHTHLTDELAQLYQTIQQNAIAEYQKADLLEEEVKSYYHPDSVLTTYQTIIQHQEKGLTGNKLMKAILEENDRIGSTFSLPLNTKKIAHQYSVPDTLIQSLTTSSVIAETDTVTKGYSPFTSEYKDFIFEADSIAKNKGLIKPDSLVQEIVFPDNGFDVDTALQHELNLLWDQNFQYLVNDTLFTRAARDSLFPHELLTMYNQSSLKRYWDIYLNQWTELAAEAIQNNTAGTKNRVEQELAIADVPTEPSATKAITIKPEFDSRQTTEAESVDVSNTKNPLKEIPIIQPGNEDQTLYFIQIAASREPLTNRFIKTFYKGDDTIFTRIEENWYKYQVGKTPHFSEALKTLNNTKVKGAFIVPYAGNEKLVLWQTLQPKSIVIPNMELEDLTFVIQLAASRDRLSAFQVNRLVRHVKGTVREIMEDKWYKYQLVVGPSYSEAKQKWQQIGSTKSFIVPYLHNEKIEMTKAFTILKGN